jgi:hypothetical protein
VLQYAEEATPRFQVTGTPAGAHEGDVMPGRAPVEESARPESVDQRPRRGRHFEAFLNVLFELRTT